MNIEALVDFHFSHKKIATVTAVQPPGKFGALRFGKKSQVDSFDEKPADEGGWINAGFFVLSPKVFDYLRDGDQTIWERSPLENLAKDNQLLGYIHRGFWKCMDTLREKNQLESLWAGANAPWKVWEDS